MSVENSPIEPIVNDAPPMPAMTPPRITLR